MQTTTPAMIADAPDVPPKFPAAPMPATEIQLPAPLLEAIARQGETRSFPARAILINEGDPTDSLYTLYIVLTGRVKV